MVSYVNKYFSRAIFSSRKSLSADWDTNPDPSISGRVPLPLDHLLVSYATRLIEIKAQLFHAILSRSIS